MSLLDDVVKEAGIDAEIVIQQKTGRKKFSDLEQIQRLLRMDLLEESRLIHQLSAHYGIPLLEQVLEQVTHHPRSDFSHRVFEQTHILPVWVDEQNAGLISVFSDWLALNRAAFHLGGSAKWYLAEQHQIEALLDTSRENEQSNDATATSVIRQLFEEAINQRGSDIHLEPEEQQLRVRYRIDGYLQDATPLALSMQPLIFSRLKLLAGMDIAVRRQPQDGHYSYHSHNQRIFDVRVSTLPGQFGEKLVLRLLDQTPVQHRLEALGFLKNDLEMLYEASQATSGMILMVGPTGSGKTTTLYAILNALNSSEKNILTIENPVEYHVEGITQVSVNPDQGLSFADTLRAALRQDPDVLLVGEIRDEETASIAVKSSLTGHLVLSTLHSNDAVTAIQRLLNLGIAPDLLAETLNLIVSQRLIRRICKHNDAATENGKNGKNCVRCRGTGYFGRVPVYEILQVNALLRDRIRKGETGQKLIEPNPDLHFHSMEQTANRLTEQGLTDWSEVRPILLNQ